MNRRREPFRAPADRRALPSRRQARIKLIEKLAAAGQLSAGFLLRVLHQGQLDLFELAFAKLLQIDLPQLRGLLY